MKTLSGEKMTTKTHFLIIIISFSRYLHVITIFYLDDSADTARHEDAQIFRFH